jgi:hypothetical protein
LTARILQLLKRRAKTAQSASEPMNRQRFLLPALLALTLARLIFISVHELSEVERHVVECSQHEGLWKPAMGPVLPLLVKASTALFGIHPFSVRFFAPFLILGAGCLVWMMMRGMFDATTASWALVMFQATPAVNLAAVTITHTTLGIATSVAVLFCLRHALHREHRWRMQWWALAGALVLAIFVDWRLFMLAVSCVAGMALTQRGRRALMKWPVLPILGLSVGLALTFFLAWNSEHGWPAFAPFPGTAPPTFYQLSMHVLLAISPLLLAGYGWSLVKSVTGRPMEYAVAFLYAFAWPLVSLDVLSWMVLPWPQCGFGAWIAPAVMLLAFHTMSEERTPTRFLMLARWMMVAAAAVQSCIMMQRGLETMETLPW